MIPIKIDKTKIPQRSGVYIFKNDKGQVLYVGKAVSLYHRVASHFVSKNPKSQAMTEQISSVNTIVVESELEALILEANLIKKYLPAYNIRLRDDKGYLYIALTSEEFPKVVTARKKDLSAVKKFWGPFPSAKTVRDALKQLRRVFPWCSRTGFRQRACFYYHLGLCPGVCARVIGKEDYNRNIGLFAKFMNGKKEVLISHLTGRMKQASFKLDFEQAQRLRKTVEGISYLTQANRVSKYLENPNFLEDEIRQALAQLQTYLNLAYLPQRIEGFDISNIRGKDATGSMVVLTNGDIDKSQYRKFKIRLTGKANDVGMMREMIRRRFRHPEWPMPDIIIVDGGKGQARAAQMEIINSQSKIPVYGLAKRMEWLYPADGEVLKLNKHSPALRLLQKLRDEAHRFAISYHRSLRQKALGLHFNLRYN